MERPNIDEIKERAKDTTDLPWEECSTQFGKHGKVKCAVTAFRYQLEAGGLVEVETIIAEAEGDNHKDSADMEFFANSKKDVLNLCAYVKYLENQ